MDNVETTTFDEREGLASASKFDIVANCPGQTQLEKAVKAAGEFPNREQLTSPEAERGTRIHLALERDDYSVCQDDEEIAAYKIGKKLEKQVLSAWVDEFHIDAVEAMREDRMWLTDDQGNRLLSGKLDRFYLGYVSGSDLKPCLIVDFKTGRALSSGRATESWQLRVQAVLAKHNFAVSSARTALIKPEVGTGVIDYCDYTADVLPMWQASIIHHLWMASQSDAPRRAGSWCRYCPVQAWCPEAGIMTYFPAYAAEQLAEKIIDPKQRALVTVNAMAPEDLATVWHNKNIIDAVLKSIVERLKTLSDDRLRELGIKRKAGRVTEKIIEPVKAAAYLQDLLALSDEQIKSVLDINKSRMVSLICEQTGGKKAKVESWLNTELEPFTETTEAEGSLMAI